MSATAPASGFSQAKSGEDMPKTCRPRSGCRICAASPRCPTAFRPETVVDILNQYFDCQVPVIREHGGEILKFMGDGLLAVFPIAKDGGNLSEVCGRVLEAGRKARANVDAMHYPSGNAVERFRFGVALHIGRILFGNIGGMSRLDFTCIGPAVNLAARLEKIAGRPHRTIVASAAFAGACANDWTDLGEFPIAGFSSAQRVFGLRDEVSADAVADREHRTGITLIVAAAIAWSTAPFFTRLLHYNPWTILFWRGLFGGGSIALFLIITQGRRGAQSLAAVKANGWLVACLSTIGMVSFIPSLQLTSVANVAIIVAMQPFVAAAIAWFWLREAVCRERCWRACRLAGIVIIVSGVGGVSDYRGIGLACSWCYRSR